MATPELARRFPDLSGCRVLVVGLGRSGLAAAQLARTHGARVTATDRRTAAELGPAVSQLESLGAQLVTGGHPAGLADAADLIVVSPGVPSDVELLRVARERGLPVWGEIELAARFCRGRVIGITGSNGKSTVTSMIGDVLRLHGFPGGTGGNLATPFAELLADDAEDAVHAVELSSFQLETLASLDPAVALILNLSPDHLDRYPSLEAYAEAKARLFDVQSPTGYALLNADDPPSRPFHRRGRGRRLWFSTRHPVDGAFVENGWLTLRIGGASEHVCLASQLQLPGEHNVANALAAALACRLVGCSIESIALGLRAFRALPHRLQHVGSVRDVEFYNDSKATNPASTVRALAAFEAGRVHLILGGRDKGADWDELEPALLRHARRLLLVGEASPMLERRFSRLVPTERCETVARAVRSGMDGAAAGDVVLLSPGCASFDQFRNFEERGEVFRRAVAALRKGRNDA